MTSADEKHSQPAPLTGKVRLPGDKSIGHRSILFAAIATGVSEVKTPTLGRDNLASLRIMNQLGVKYELSLPATYAALAKEEGIEVRRESADNYCYLKISGLGLDGLKAASAPLDCGNSGTSARLLCGLLAGLPFKSTLVGDESLSRRPFVRVTEPLSKMGANFSGQNLPLEINGSSTLKGIEHVSAKSSAQVKSAILLAGLHATSPVTVTEPTPSRDHTERLFKAMGCELREKATADGRWEVKLLSVPREKGLKAFKMEVPGDYSAAAFFIVAGTILPGSKLLIENVGFNKTRIGLHTVMNRMGARVNLINKREVAGEDVCDLDIAASELIATDVTAVDVADAIDEIPILAVAAAFAKGITRISGAEELRVKESDRLAMVSALLRSFSLDVKELPDGLIVVGNPAAIGSAPKRDAELEQVWRSSGDHRISMAGAVLEYALYGKLEVTNVPAVETSFPGFKETFSLLCAAGK